MENNKRTELKKSTKKRVYRFTSQMRGTPKIQPNEYYHTDRNKKLKPISPLDVKSEGVKYSTVIDLFDKEKHITDSLRNTIKGGIFNLTSIFNDYEYETSSVELNDLIQEIPNLNIIHPKKEYTGYALNEQGYVCGRGYDIIREVDDNEPEDFDKGYWNLIDDEWIMDEDKFKQLWSVIL
jgi:hypothetical protein